MRLVALEVTQGLQDWNGSIDLVAGKRTVVRAFLEPGAGQSATARVLLDLVGDDGSILESMTPVNANLVVTPYETHNFRTRAGNAGERENLNASANFVLDDASWIGKPGDGDSTRTYRLSIDPHVDCQEAIPPANRCTADITFTDIKAPRVVLVPLRIGGTSTKTAPTDEMIVEHMRRIKSLMPVPGVDVFVHSQMEPTLPDTMPDPKDQPEAISTAIWNELVKVQANYPGSVILGLAYELARPGWGYSSWNGAAYFDTQVAWWKTDAKTALIGSDVRGRNTGSHELGHLLGAGHAVYWAPPHVFNVACSQSVEEAALKEYPYLAPVPPGGTGKLALLGPTAGPNQAVWGLDTRVFDDIMALPAKLAVMDPSQTFSIMSYCSGAEDDGRQDRWVDEYYHEMFMRSLLGVDWGPVLVGATAADDDAGARDPAGSGDSVRDVLVVSGARTVAADGSVDVVLSPTYTYATASPMESQNSGEWVLELLDGAGAVLRSVPFGADTPTVDIDPDSGTEAAPSTELWRVAVPDAPAYSSYRIRQESQAVAVSAVSSAAPVVSVTAPAAGQAFGGASVSVSWAASDADGDDLVYHVHYSADGGATYSTVGAALRSTTLVLDRDQLAGSSQAVFRVIASDGTRSTTAQSAVFTVAENPPAVIVHSPEGGRVFGGAGTVVLDATGIDAEDGVMADTALVWSSDIDGQIASTAAARIPTDALSTGTHVLTVTATDSSAMAASASVSVTVRATNGAPTARADVAHSRVGHTAIARVLANDADPESDIDPWSVRVVVPAALGTAAANSPAPGAIAYDAAATGIDVIIYEVCDRFLQCATAELTVAVLDDR